MKFNIYKICWNNGFHINIVIIKIRRNRTNHVSDRFHQMSHIMHHGNTDVWLEFYIYNIYMIFSCAWKRDTLYFLMFEVKLHLKIKWSICQSTSTQKCPESHIACRYWLDAGVHSPFLSSCPCSVYTDHQHTRPVFDIKP